VFATFLVASVVVGTLVTALIGRLASRATASQLRDL